MFQKAKDLISGKAKDEKKGADAKGTPGKLKAIKPEGLRKKQERDAALNDQLTAKREARKQEMASKKQYYFEQGKKHWESFTNQQKQIIEQKRQAKDSNSFYVVDEPKVFFVVRVKGLNRIPPKEKKILQLFRLRQLHNGVFVRNNKATLTMLRRIEPWITYGFPSHTLIKRLVYKRGYGKINGQRIPLGSNLLIEENLGEKGIKCVEDIINEIYTCGPHFKEANNFLWPFKLNSPKGGIESIRHPYLQGGATGPREEFINELAHRMV